MALIIFLLWFTDLHAQIQTLSEQAKNTADGNTRQNIFVNIN